MAISFVFPGFMHSRAWNSLNLHFFIGFDFSLSFFCFFLFCCIERNVFHDHPIVWHFIRLTKFWFRVSVFFWNDVELKKKTVKSFRITLQVKKKFLFFLFLSLISLFFFFFRSKSKYFISAEREKINSNCFFFVDRFDTSWERERGSERRQKTVRSWNFLFCFKANRPEIWNE